VQQPGNIGHGRDLYDLDTCARRSHALILKAHNF